MGYGGAFSDQGFEGLGFRTAFLQGFRIAAGVLEISFTFL